jgi:KTSC domain
MGIFDLLGDIRDFNPVEEVFGNWTPVSSTNVAAYRYNPGKRVLQVKFTSGRVYGYKDVPENVVEEFASSDSKGKFLNANIKHNYSLE